MRVSVYTRRLAAVAVAVVTLSTGTAAVAAPGANNVPSGMVTAGRANQPIHAADPVGVKAKAQAAPAGKTRCVGSRALIHPAGLAGGAPQIAGQAGHPGGRRRPTSNSTVDVI